MNTKVYKKKIVDVKKIKYLRCFVGKWVEVKWQEAPDLFTTLIGEFTRLGWLQSGGHIMVVSRVYDESKETRIPVSRIREIRFFSETPKRFRPKALRQAKKEEQLKLLQEQERLNQLLAGQSKG